MGWFGLFQLDPISSWTVWFAFCLCVAWPNTSPASGMQFPVSLPSVFPFLVGVHHFSLNVVPVFWHILVSAGPYSVAFFFFWGSFCPGLPHPQTNLMLTRVRARNVNVLECIFSSFQLEGFFHVFFGPPPLWDTWEENFGLESRSCLFSEVKPSICLKTNVRNWVVFWNMPLWLRLGDRWGIKITSAT